MNCPILKIVHNDGMIVSRLLSLWRRDHDAVPEFLKHGPGENLRKEIGEVLFTRDVFEPHNALVPEGFDPFLSAVYVLERRLECSSFSGALGRSIVQEHPERHWEPYAHFIGYVAELEG